MSTKKLLTIPMLWFDAKGYGPSELEVDVVSNQEDDPEFKAIPPVIGLRFMARSDAGFVMENVEPILGGGPFMHREQVEQLHRVLGEWLAYAAARDKGAS